MFRNYTGFNATFTNLGLSGTEGPESCTVCQLYKGEDHDGQVRLSSGIQQWTVPFTGQYRIETVGAAGGYDDYQNSAHSRGRGARMVGTFNLSQDEIIQILVGQEGGIRRNGRSSGGGGGTFVVRGRNTPLIVAGGGGGLRAVKSKHQGCDANAGTSGNAGYKAWSGGSDGYVSKNGGHDDGSSGESTVARKNYFHFTK